MLNILTIPKKTTYEKKIQTTVMAKGSYRDGPRDNNWIGLWIKNLIIRILRNLFFKYDQDGNYPIDLLHNNIWNNKR